MTTLKIDSIIFTSGATDETLQLSGVTTITGVIDPATENITTTGVISGAVYKTSGNVVVISGLGDVRPYGLFSFPSSLGTSGYNLSTDANGSTSWVPASVGLTTAFYIALNKC